MKIQSILLALLTATSPLFADSPYRCQMSGKELEADSLSLVAE